MNTEENVTRKNPKETANFFSKLFVCWTLDIFKKSAKRALKLSDLYRPLKNDESEFLCGKLEREWNRELEKLKNLEFTLGKSGKKEVEKSKNRPSLSRALLRFLLWDNIEAALLIILQALIMRSSMPIFQRNVINYFNNDYTITRNDTLYYAAGLIICIFVITFAMHHYYLKTQQIGLRMRVACTSMIYKKLLRLEKSALDQTDGGQVLNLLSNDVNRFELLITYGHWIWCSILQVIIIAYIIWSIAGYAAMIGIAVLIIISFPSHVFISKMSKILRTRVAAITDKRIQLMNELVAGIQVIKMYAWEVPFGNMISRTRANEMKQIRLSSYMKAFLLGTIVVMERLTLFAAAVTNSLMGRILTADITFSLATYYNTLQMGISICLPNGLVMLSEAMISIKRIEKFLLLNEVNQSRTKIVHDEKSSSNVREKVTSREVILGVANEEEQKPVKVKFSQVCANWNVGKLPPTLCNVSMTIEGGQLCAVVGLVGSGKTALLNVLLKELPIGAGTVSLLRKSDNPVDKLNASASYVVDDLNICISYASQDAWIFLGTVRDNILFGQPFEANRYKQVTQVCALHRDFRQLPFGDMTIVGERGMSLSGGQRARINLARAVYKRADLYLLDDPLSAVDTKVGQHLFQHCIVEYLRGKTRILVTHQLQFLEHVDTIALVERGTVICQGSYRNLINSNSKFIALQQRKEDDPVEQPSNSQDKRDSIMNSTSEKSNIRKRIFHQDSNSNMNEHDDNDIVNLQEKDNEEEIEEGVVKWKIFKTYFQAGSSWFSLTLLTFLFVLSQSCNNVNDYWVSYWTNLNSIRKEINEGNVNVLNEKYASFVNDTFLSNFGLDKYGLLYDDVAIYIYTFFIGIVIVTNYMRSILFMRNCAASSYNLHNTMFANVLRARMLFFNTNPSGRILNRFSKDIGAMDELLPRIFLETLQIFLVMVGALVMISIVNYWMIIPIVVIVTIVYTVMKIFIVTVNLLKRYEGTTKSPIYSHVNTTLNGLTTIRCAGKQIEQMMIKQLDSYQDVHTGVNYLIFATSTTLCLFIDLLCDCFAACVTLSLVLTKTDTTFGGNVGLAISQSLILIGMVQYGLRQYTEAISQMTSVERVVQYTDLPQESPLESSDPPPATWPSEGRIAFRHVYMRYKDTDSPVLKDLNVTVEPGWKVGIVGRTGAGKSSLISAIFRLTGCGLEGSIIIDGIDTASLGLPDLRSRISIIPQEPVLFSESLRYNLDPFGHFPDSELWAAIREVELNDVSLDQQVLEGGSNFSVGQRQLICLARAILRNNRILVLDEATANIDSHTDFLIQRTIRKRFANCTVLTIAHRLNTIIDSDRIVVMDSGRMVEFGSPYELLHDKQDGYFLNMVKQLGPTMTEELMRLAQQARQENTKQCEYKTLTNDASNSSNMTGKEELSLDQDTKL